MSKKNMNDLIRDMQLGIADGLLAVFGINTTYKPESLDEVEERINDAYPEGHEPLPTTLIPFGFYLGETIVRNIPHATWEPDDAETVWDIAIKIETPSGVNSVLYPFRRIDKFWHDRTDGLSAFYRLTHLVSVTNPESLEDTNGGWITFPNGDKMRMTKIDKDQLH